ncbi:MAG: chemotaxis protein CheD [Victivallales bacterium]|nr:chemotaxis protein CheD [Victivallales bacterium]
MMKVAGFGSEKVILLGIGDYGATGDQTIKIKTLALGSCVAVVLLDPRVKVAGMVHIALPDSQLQGGRKEFKPGYFADTGIPVLLQEMRKFGSSGILRDMYVKLAGGARVIRGEGVLDIGRRNIAAVKAILKENGVRPVAHDVGNTISRTVTVELKTGIVRLSCPGRDDWFI